ncbi:MAG: serine/threonine-protein kinase [Thermoanaerobaculia bacterium]|nr:serine/threonine-protein kinase [Thermoanaerobaculia bacterium]MBP9824787.1 serine/threonine-protein kinase [Thermoanaerobaculia bacterium]
MIGTELAHYRITAKLGEGGMGEVWRATDSKLGREVAIKVLPESFSSDPERLARFEREAKVLASLNHPHIAAIYGLEEVGGGKALVLELVEGPTLGERLAQGQLPFEEALTIARQIAEALEEAHEKGIVHRDLKPANVKLTAGGKVKVLDFGLAKALDPMTSSGSSASQLAHSPTLSLGATMQGVILGTAAYMSPEQARGANADRRADVWAFGVVLFEMLSGRTLFAGPTVSDTLASVLKEEPDLAQLPPSTPARIRRLLERCLRKDAQQRLHSIADARIMIEEVQRGEVDEPGTGSGTAVAQRPRWQVAAALALAALAGGALFALVARIGAPAPAAPRVVRFDLPQPADLMVVGAPKVSPDGRHIAFDGRDKAGKVQIWLRSLDESVARPLAGTENVKTAGRPFWSPDSRYLAYFSADKLIKIPIEGGPAQKICDADGADGSWSEQGLILFDGTATAPLMSVPASGGVPKPVIAARDGEAGMTFGWPQFLPGGERFLYVAGDSSEELEGIWMAKADGTDRRRVVPGLSRAEYAPPGWLLFVRDSTLVAQRFDAGTGKVSGEPIPVADGLTVSTVGLAEFSASLDGVLAFRTSGAVGEQLAYLDRRGGRDTVAVESGLVGHPAFSPDGRWLAFDKRSEGGQPDIWLRDLRRGVSSRFTTAPVGDFAPLFSPDGERLYFGREAEGGKSTLMVRPLAVGSETELHTAEGVMAALAVTPDEKQLVFAKMVGGAYDLFALDLSAGNRVTPITETPGFAEFRADLSPDGRWLALQSDESGVAEIYVQPFPGPGRRWQLSTGGGFFPVWSRGGNEIFFRDGQGQLSHVAVTAGAEFDAGVPEVLFPLAIGTGNSVRKFVVTPDGQRFLAQVPTSEAGKPTSVIVGWDANLPH